MMEILLTALSGICLITGAFLLFSGGVGVLRFPDFYTRMHAAGVTETLATSLILIGLMILAGWSIELLKLILILLFTMITGPTASHALAKAARQGKLRPWSQER